MNIEDVKERLSNLDAGKVVKYDHAMNLATQYMIDYKNDVSYLLSIIEQKDAELIKAIDEIKYQVKRNDKQREGYFKQEAIIAKAEHAFEEINYQFELHEHEVVDNAIKKVDDIATEALQAIRKGD